MPERPSYEILYDLRLGIPWRDVDDEALTLATKHSHQRVADQLVVLRLLPCVTPAIHEHPAREPVQVGHRQRAINAALLVGEFHSYTLVETAFSCSVSRISS